MPSDIFAPASSQGGRVFEINSGSVVNLPITYTSYSSYCVVGNDINNADDPLVLSFEYISKASFNIYGRRVDYKSALWCRWISVGV